MTQLCFDFDAPNLPFVEYATVNEYSVKPDLNTTTDPALILKFYGQSFLTGWLKVKNSVRF